MFLSTTALFLPLPRAGEGRGEGARMIIITPQERFFHLRPLALRHERTSDVFERFFRCRTSEAGVPGHSIFHKWP